MPLIFALPFAFGTAAWVMSSLGSGIGSVAAAQQPNPSSAAAAQQSAWGVLWDSMTGSSPAVAPAATSSVSTTRLFAYAALLLAGAWALKQFGIFRRGR